MTNGYENILNDFTCTCYLQDEALVTLKRQLEREKEEEMSRLKEKLVRVSSPCL